MIYYVKPTNTAASQKISGITLLEGEMVEYIDGLISFYMLRELVSEKKTS